MRSTLVLALTCAVGTLAMSGCLDDEPTTTVVADNGAEVATSDTPGGDASAPDVATSETTDPTDVPPAIDVIDDSEPTGPPPIIETATTFIGDWTMQPGKETTKCVVKRLGNPDPLWIQQIRTELAKGSHHMIIYKSDATEEQLTPFNCDPFLETISGETVPLMITQIANETLTFPPGVAFKFEPNQMVRIEAHFLNYYPDEIVAHGDVHFDAIAEEDVVDEANILFYGTPDISIPANSTKQTPWHYLTVPEGAKVFATTGHTHQYGTLVEIQKSTDGAEGDDIYPLGEPFVWDEPPVTTYDPPLAFAQSEGFRYRCTWDNTSNKNVGFGESANQEMCFLWAYYYPSVGYRICVNPGGLGAGLVPEQVCCPEGPGSELCSLVQGFISNGL